MMMAEQPLIFGIRIQVRSHYVSGKCNFAIDVCACDSIHGCKEGLLRLLANEHMIGPIIILSRPQTTETH